MKVSLTKSSVLERDRQVRKVIVIEGLANLAVLLIKTTVGLMTGSLAILGDAIHSLTDIANNVIAWVVVRLANQPPDREHPYGHRKFETLAVFGLATLLTVLAIELALHAMRRESVTVAQTSWGLLLMLVVLGVNIALASWQRYWAQRLQSDILLADASHTFADVLTTLVVIGGWQLSAVGYAWLDTVCALGVVVLILYLAYGLFQRAIPVLVDHIAIEPEPLRSAVLKIKGVREVRQIRSRWDGSASVVDMVIAVDSRLPTDAAHAIADAIESMLKRDFQVTDTTIHIEPSGEQYQQKRYP